MQKNAAGIIKIRAFSEMVTIRLARMLALPLSARFAEVAAASAKGEELPYEPEDEYLILVDMAHAEKIEIPLKAISPAPEDLILEGSHLVVEEAEGTIEGAVGSHPDGSFLVRIFLNPFKQKILDVLEVAMLGGRAYTVATALSYLRAEFFKIFKTVVHHELLHAADSGKHYKNIPSADDAEAVFNKRNPYLLRPEGSPIDLTSYYSSPSEMRSFAAELADKIWDSYTSIFHNIISPKSVEKWSNPENWPAELKQDFNYYLRNDRVYNTVGKRKKKAYAQMVYLQLKELIQNIK